MTLGIAGFGAAVAVLCSILTPLSAGRFFGVKECHSAGDKKPHLMSRSHKINGAQKIGETRTKGENELMNRGESAALPSRRFRKHAAALLEKCGGWSYISSVSLCDSANPYEPLCLLIHRPIHNDIVSYMGF